MRRSTARRTTEDLPTSSGWPLARSLGLGVVRPGGLSATRRLFEGVQLGPGDRVIDLFPGAGETGLLATEHNLYSWTGICRDEMEARSVKKAIPGPVVATVIGTPDHTGLSDGEASVVYAEGLLTGIPVDAQSAVLRESARLLRPNGLVGFHELAITRGGPGSISPAVLATEFAAADRGGLYPHTEDEWRQLINDAGLEFVGANHFAVVIPSAKDVIRDEGPRRGLEILGKVARPGATSSQLKNAINGIARAQDRLTGVVLIARRPYVGPLRSRAARS